MTRMINIPGLGSVKVYDCNVPMEYGDIVVTVGTPLGLTLRSNIAGPTYIGKDQNTLVKTLRFREFK